MDDPVVKLLEQRWAGRGISNEPISPEAVEILAEAARLTPSCYNNQPWRFIFLTGEEALAKGRETLTGGNRKWAVTAPLLVFAYSKPQDDCQTDDGRDYHQFDTGMAAMNLMLAATAQGLAARPMAGFEPEKVKQAFNLSDDDAPILAIAVGKPSTEEDHLPDYYKGLHKKPRKRKPKEEVIEIL